MAKSICRIVIGLVLMWGGWQGMLLATAITKDTISPPPPATTSELPRRPSELMEDPAIQKRLDEAADLSRMSGLAVLLGGALTLWGCYPTIRAAAVWLLVPEWLMHRTAKQAGAISAGECKEDTANAETSPRHSLGGLGGDCGHLPEPAAPGGNQRCDGGNLPGGAGGTGSV